MKILINNYLNYKSKIFKINNNKYESFNESVWLSNYSF